MIACQFPAPLPATFLEGAYRAVTGNSGSASIPLHDIACARLLSSDSMDPLPEISIECWLHEAYGRWAEPLKLLLIDFEINCSIFSLLILDD